MSEEIVLRVLNEFKESIQSEADVRAREKLE